MTYPLKAVNFMSAVFSALNMQVKLQSMGGSDTVRSEYLYASYMLSNGYCLGVRFNIEPDKTLVTYRVKPSEKSKKVGTCKFELDTDTPVIQAGECLTKLLQRCA